VSDLQCPARLFIARHGDATYAVPGVLGDEGGWLTPLGRAQVTALAAELAPQRVAAVYSSTMSRAVESGSVAAEALGVQARAVVGLQECSIGAQAGPGRGDPAAFEAWDAWLEGDMDMADPSGETGHEVVARFGEALQRLADQHRGEQVVVFSHSGVMALVIPRLSVNVRGDLAARQPLPCCSPVTLEIDADGWWVRDWPRRTCRH